MGGQRGDLEGKRLADTGGLDVEEEEKGHYGDGTSSGSAGNTSIEAHDSIPHSHDQAQSKEVDGKDRRTFAEEEESSEEGKTPKFLYRTPNWITDNGNCIAQGFDKGKEPWRHWAAVEEESSDESSKLVGTHTVRY